MLVVDKSTRPASDRGFGFAWGPEGGLQERFTLTDEDQPFTTEPLAPGAYTVSESGADGWQLEFLACTGSSGDPVLEDATATVDVRAGDTVLCRFINVRADAPGLPPDPDPDPEPGPGPGGGALPVTGLDACIAALAAALLVAGVVMLRARPRLGRRGTTGRAG
ncbi:hypothetical protein LEP48_11110 [Isoptericola sp. NEAU-Y5]|uniref:SpaA-like prealbumin fold domain-containing protein n=1 Tax=Isoptericola luteus TaxID=2879484 RepID=A0ABS7ZFU4_9MICO|nr:hypothetical protein [Isoptericola sp. NEAU-Y5]MCA5893897.1 hypothetical protein [Isoptericola sp. NEAU-Y5]